jgi:hypothetical protein
MRKFSKKQYLAAGAAAALIAGGAGVAFAYWTSTGSGSGTATTDTAKNWTVVVDSTDLKDLSPNGPVETVHFHVTNPGSGVQHLNNTVASVASTSAGANCAPGNFAVGTPVITYGDVASHTTVDGTFTLQMVDTGVPQDGCQNVTVNLQVDAS